MSIPNLVVVAGQRAPQVGFGLSFLARVDLDAVLMDHSRLDAVPGQWRCPQQSMQVRQEVQTSRRFRSLSQRNMVRQNASKGRKGGRMKGFRNGDGNHSSGQATNTKSTGQTTNTNSSVQTTNTYSSGQIDKREIHKARDKRHLQIARDKWPLTNTNFKSKVEVVLDHHLMLWAQNLSFLSLVFFAELQFGYSRCRLDMEIRGPSYPIYYLWKWNEIVYV